MMAKCIWCNKRVWFWQRYFRTVEGKLYHTLCLVHELLLDRGM